MDEDIVIFRVEEERFGFPVEEVREVLEPMETTKVPKAPPWVEGIVNLRGRVVPILNLRKRLGFPKGEGREEGILLVEIEGRIVGFLVDEVEGISGIPAENIALPNTLKESKVDLAYLTGVGELKEGTVVLLDLRKILEAK